MPNTQRALPVSRYGIEWLLLGSALLVVALIIGHFMSEMRKDIETRERDRLTVQARVIHDALERQIDTINRTLVGIRDELPYWRSESDGRAQAQGRLKAGITESTPSSSAARVWTVSHRTSSTS